MSALWFIAGAVCGLIVGVTAALMLVRWAFCGLRLAQIDAGETRARIEETRQRIRQGARGSEKGAFKL